jgi:hypothetical protein
VPLIKSLLVKCMIFDSSVHFDFPHDVRAFVVTNTIFRYILSMCLSMDGNTIENLRIADFWIEMSNLNH